MKEWTREERYRTILEASDEEMSALKEKEIGRASCRERV